MSAGIGSLLNLLASISLEELHYKLFPICCNMLKDAVSGIYIFLP